MNDKLKLGGLIAIIIAALVVVGMVAMKSVGPEKPNVVGTIKETDPAITGSQPGVGSSTAEDPSSGAPAGAASGATAPAGTTPAPGSNF